MALTRHSQIQGTELDCSRAALGGGLINERPTTQIEFWGVLFCAQIGCGDGLARGICSHRPYWAGIPRNQRIDGKQCDTLYGRLCNQHAIKRILVKHGQALDGDNVVADNRHSP